MDIIHDVLHKILKGQLSLNDIETLEGRRDTIIALAKSVSRVRVNVEQLSSSLEKLFSQRRRYKELLAQFDPFWAHFARNMTREF